MPQQTTLLSFFNRTPKSTSSSSPSTSGSVTNGGSASAGGDSKVNQNGTPKTPKQNHESRTPSTLKTPVTPVSRNGTGAKRRRTSGGQSAEQQSSRKKLRNEDSRKYNLIGLDNYVLTLNLRLVLQQSVMFLWCISF